MKIVNANTQDTGGQCYKLSKMINENYKGVHQSRAFVKGDKGYIDYPHDILFETEWIKKGVPAWIKEYWVTADILHVHNKIRRAKGWSSINPKAGIIMHQHGRFPTQHDLDKMWLSDEENKIIRVVSTLNLMKYIKNGNYKRWFPTPVDVSYLQEIKTKYHIPHDTIKIMHSPTQRHLKHTDLFIDVVKKLQIKYPQVEMVLMENVSNISVLRARASADIIYDQLLLQHGSNGLEGMAMGIPVVAGTIASPEVRPIMKELLGYFPFADATPETLYLVLEKLIIDKEYYNSVSERGLDYVNKWHTAPYVTKLAIETYKEAIKLKQG